MKTLQLATCVMIAAVCPALGQGQVTFGNYIPGILETRIYGPEFDVANGGDYAYAKTGNTTSGIPAGTQIYNGALLEGWSVSFWAAFPGADTNSGSQFLQGDAIATIGSGSDAGFFSLTAVTFWFLPPTGQAMVQVRVWDSNGGARSWGETHTLLGPRLSGASALFTVDIGGTALDFRSFSAGFLDPLTFAPPVPEPSMFGLFGLGCLLLGWRFSKRRSS